MQGPTHGIFGDAYVKLAKEMRREGCDRPTGEPISEFARLRHNRLPEALLAVGVDTARTPWALSELQAAEPKPPVIVEPALHGRGMLPQPPADFRYGAAFCRPQHGTESMGVSDIPMMTTTIKPRANGRYIGIPRHVGWG